MIQVTQSAIGLAQGSALLFSDYVDGGEMWTGQGTRTVRHPVSFRERFAAAPVVHVGMTMWDVANDSNQRLDISSDEITDKGFIIVFRTWGDTRVARIRADWLAIGPMRHPDDFILDQ